MADLINVRPRPGVRINLHPVDICNVVTQPEVICAFSTAELKEIHEVITKEINQRKAN